MPFKIVRNDITQMYTEAIVNTANENAVVGAGCDSAIYEAAGYDKLLEYRREKIGKVPEGEAFITPGFKLRAKYIIHTVSPAFIDGNHGEEEKLRSCYRNSLRIAVENKIRSIAFPLISTGSFGYPKEEGMRIAVDEISAFLMNHEMQVYLVVYDDTSTALGRRLRSDIEEYIDQNYIDNKRDEWFADEMSQALGSAPASEMSQALGSAPASEMSQALGSAPASEAPRASSRRFGVRPRDFILGLKAKASKSEAPRAENASFIDEALTEQEKDSTHKKTQKKPHAFEKSDEIVESDAFEDTDELVEYAEFEDAGSMNEAYFEEFHESRLAERMQHISDTFAEYLLYLIQDKHMENVDVYKRAIVDKKVFSKIKNNADYHPNKLTAMCLCVGAKLSLDETRDLLARAGYALSPCDKTDIIFKYFIENEIYDMIELDIQLEEHGLPCIIT